MSRRKGNGFRRVRRRHRDPTRKSASRSTTPNDGNIVSPSFNWGPDRPSGRNLCVRCTETTVAIVYRVDTGRSRTVTDVCPTSGPRGTPLTHPPPEDQPLPPSLLPIHSELRSVRLFPSGTGRTLHRGEEVETSHRTGHVETSGVLPDLNLGDWCHSETRWGRLPEGLGKTLGGSDEG